MTIRRYAAWLFAHLDILGIDTDTEQTADRHPQAVQRWVWLGRTASLADLNDRVGNDTMKAPRHADERPNSGGGSLGNGARMPGVGPAG